MKKLYSFILLILFAIASNGQDRIQSSRNITIKFPLSSLFGDFYAESMGIGLGLEKMIKPSLSFSQEISYIFHINNNSILTENVESINGVKFTTEIRKYLSKKEIPESGWFVNLELKNIFTQSTQVIGMNLENNITRYRGVFTANFGTLVYWDRNKKGRVTLEILGGGGLGYINANSSVDIENLTNKSDYNSANKFYPWLNFDIKIGYILK
jgi:hypothetical protein